MLEYGNHAHDPIRLLHTYDLDSVGIISHPLAIDINKSNGLFYIQENNVRVVEFNKESLKEIHPARFLTQH